MARYNVIKNPIMKVYWAGWESTTLALQRGGWQLSVEEDVYNCSFRLALYHPGLRFSALSARIDFHHMEYFHGQQAMFGDRLPPVPIERLACDMRVSVMENSFNFQPVDATPQFMTMAEPKNITDFHIFRHLDAVKEIIIEPKNVDELMDKILSMQSPKQAELRQKRMRQTEIPDNVLDMGKYKEIYNPKTDIIAQVVAIG